MRYFLLLCALLLACGGGRALPPTPTAAPAMHTITYKIEGSKFAKADLTYQNASGNSQQEEVSIPWETSFTAPPGQFVYLSGQLNSKGTIRCRILVDGQPLEEAESKGEYVIASCSGSVPR